MLCAYFLSNKYIAHFNWEVLCIHYTHSLVYICRPNRSVRCYFVIFFSSVVVVVAVCVVCLKHTTWMTTCYFYLNDFYCRCLVCSWRCSRCFQFAPSSWSESIGVTMDEKIRSAAEHTSTRADWLAIKSNRRTRSHTQCAFDARRSDCLSNSLRRLMSLATGVSHDWANGWRRSAFNFFFFLLLYTGRLFNISMFNVIKWHE